MALEGEQLLAGRAVPNPHRLVIAPRSQSLAVRARRKARNPMGVILEEVQLLAGHTVPDLLDLVISPWHVRSSCSRKADWPRSRIGAGEEGGHHHGSLLTRRSSVVR